MRFNTKYFDDIFIDNNFQYPYTYYFYKNNILINEIKGAVEFITFLLESVLAGIPILKNNSNEFYVIVLINRKYLDKS